MSSVFIYEVNRLVALDMHTQVNLNVQVMCGGWTTHGFHECKTFVKRICETGLKISDFLTLKMSLI